MQAPAHASYDVVIVGGAMYGSSVAWWLSGNPDFQGRILVVERDPSYEFASTTHTNSCIRQQFTADLNVKISQFGAEFIHNFRDFMGGDDRVPDIALHSLGYMYMAATPEQAAGLKQAQEIQAANGAGTRHMTADQIAAEYPFYNLDGVLAANHNPVNEGYFDGATIFDWWKRSARERGVEYIHNEATAMTLDATGTQAQSVTLASGETVNCGQVVNASGPRAKLTCAMVGIDIPVEPRKRYTFVWDAETPLNGPLPLTIDPSGCTMRTDGQYFLGGCPPDDDPAVDYADFVPDHSVWEEKFWPAIAHRVPQFEAIKLINSWVGHYAYNTLDHNAVVGPHTRISNFLFVNGFSGHGLQQSPAIGRGLAEWIVYGEYRSIDLSEFGYGRIERNEPFIEKAVI
ncbi:MAG: NAD(P)/FAD-dependent oxidoreductase [Paracoccaceae bacterium]